jgi:hypothetical protein
MIYRAMREDIDGHPVLGPSARTLGVRSGTGPNTDIPVQPSGTVLPQTGGMSAAPDQPRNLPAHRRPPAFGGWGQDPVWGLELNDLPGDLHYEPDPVPAPRHGLVEPTSAMPLGSYERALESTRYDWLKTTSAAWTAPAVMAQQDVPQPFVDALDASDPVVALRDAVERELLETDRASASARQVVYEELEALRAHLRETDDNREDAVMDVMDFVVGWCSPHARI